MTATTRSSRRAVLAGLAAAATLPASALRAAASDAAARTLLFDVSREGGPIGTHRLDFRSLPDGSIEVRIAIRLSVGIGPITLYRYTHDSRETWRDGALVALETRTDDDGRAHEVTARAEGGRLLIAGSAGQAEAPLGTAPTSYWARGMVRAGRMINTQTGALAECRIEPRGVERIAVGTGMAEAERIRLEGDLKMDLWHLPNGEWAGLAFRARGAEIVYQRRTEAAARPSPQIAFAPPT